jgi:hypothetical protein
MMFYRRPVLAQHQNILKTLKQFEFRKCRVANQTYKSATQQAMIVAMPPG